jgi:hypothetical protein
LKLLEMGDGGRERLVGLLPDNRGQSFPLDAFTLTTFITKNKIDTPNG